MPDSSKPTARDVTIVLMSAIVLRWLEQEKSTHTVGQMADAFLAALDREGFEIVSKRHG